MKHPLRALWHRFRSGEPLVSTAVVPSFTFEAASVTDLTAAHFRNALASAIAEHPKICGVCLQPIAEDEAIVMRVVRMRLDRAEGPAYLGLAVVASCLVCMAQDTHGKMVPIPEPESR